MRLLTLLLLAFTIVVGCEFLFAQKSPEQVVFQTKMGNVTFNHSAHLKRVNGDCKVCHDKLFPQSNASINYKAGMHKTAEAARTSCAACHNAGGTAFESKGNCARCHMKS